MEAHTRLCLSLPPPLCTSCPWQGDKGGVRAERGLGECSGVELNPTEEQKGGTHTPLPLPPSSSLHFLSMAGRQGRRESRERAGMEAHTRLCLSLPPPLCTSCPWQGDKGGVSAERGLGECSGVEFNPTEEQNGGTHTPLPLPPSSSLHFLSMAGRQGRRECRERAG
ncbi:unnamed protein product [Closterium sp. NIES-65]|nr:unnamed protein product [Closterium sp. NIES-65]